MTKTNKIVKMCVFAMLLTMIISIVSINVGAKNNIDSPFSYELTGGDNFKTPFRDKEDDSSVYMKCINATGSYEARVYSGPRNACAVDVSFGYHYHFVQGNARFMYNYAYECGYDIAAVFATTYNNGTVASGVWSPDSVWEAGVLPASDFIK